MYLFQNKLINMKMNEYARKNRITGLIFGLTALSIYGFTFYKVKQEDFLDELD